MAATKHYAVSTQHDHPAVQQLARCIEYLRSVCDGAVSRDYQGFSAFDKNLGHYLADRLAQHLGWSRADLGFAVQLAWRYREQLWNASLTFPTYAELKAEIDDLPTQDDIVVAPTPSTATVQLWLDSGWLCLAFSHYDHEKLGQLLSAVPTEDRWWDDANTRWLISPVHAAGLESLYGVTVGDAPAGQGASSTQPVQPQRTKRTTRQRTADTSIEIRDYNDRRIAVRCPFEMKDRVKAAVPWKSREWDGQDRVWLVDRAFEDAVRQALGVV